MPANKQITINSRKFDGTIHKSWSGELIEETSDYYVFLGVFNSLVEHPKLGVIRPETVSYEYYWKQKCYNVFRFFEPEGTFRNYYCNINLPPVFLNGVLDYVDLDVDVLVWKDFSFEILDLEEFEENAERYNYSPEIRSKVEQSLSELLELIAAREFPFSLKS
jgi:uncharacterized protein